MAIVIDGWAISEIDTISGFKAGMNIFELSEVQNFTLTNTEETKEFKGKNGALIEEVKTTKAASGSGTNGVLSGGLMRFVTGDDGTNGSTVIVRYKQSGVIVSDGSTEVSINLDKKISNTVTAGAEIGYAHVEHNGSTTKFEQATTATANKFTYTAATGETSAKITFAAGTLAKGDIVTFWYDIVANNDNGMSGEIIGNYSDKFAGECELVVSGLAIKCGVESEFQIIVPRASFSGNWNLEISDGQTSHPFEFKTLKNRCSGGSSKMWSFAIFGSVA